MSTRWVYFLKRDELLNHLNEFGLEQSGTVEELRKRLVKFIHVEHPEDVAARLLALQDTYEKLNSQQKAEQPATATPTPNDAVTECRTNLIDQVRKWGLSYDGGKEPLVFIERVEELAEIYEVNLDKLPKLMPEWLRKRALVWFRNNNAYWQTWSSFKSDFLSFFLPSRYLEMLEDEVKSRVQCPREAFKDYVLDLQNLMRHSSLTEEQKLQRIFRNSQPEYQRYVKRTDFSTLAELIRLAEDLEGIPTAQIRSKSDNCRPPNNLPSAQQNQCYRCGRQGHYAARCPGNANHQSGNDNGGRRN